MAVPPKATPTTRRMLPDAMILRSTGKEEHLIDLVPGAIEINDHEF